MKKIIFANILIFIFFGCQKDSIDLGPDYQKMIGNWVSINQDYPVKVCITKKNKVIIYRAIERGFRFNVEKINKKSLVELDGWQAYVLHGDYKKTDTEYLGLRANPTFDTLIFLTGSEIVDQQLRLDVDNKFIRE